MNNKYNEWCNKFMESWKKLEGIKTTELFSKDVNYFENPINAPCSSFAEVVKLWEAVPSNQKNIEYTFHILISNEEMAIINFKMSRLFILNNEIQEIDGIFQMSLDSNDLCNYFKQWRFTKTKI
jgi:hypothetical protein